MRSGAPHNHNNRRGFSLIEMTLVIALVGMAALAALPTLSASRAPRLELAAARIATALRFARDAAVRSGQPHGVLFDPLGQVAEGREVTVYRVTGEASPFGRALDVTDPLTGQPYAFDLSGTAPARDLRLDTTSAPFRFRGLGSPQWELHFLPTGAAAWLQDGAPRLLEGAALVVTDGVARRTIGVLPVSGRVVVQ